MKVVTIDNKYIDYLRKYDKYILKNDGENYIYRRKYIGVIFSKGDLDYFIPLSSPDKKDDYVNGEIRKSSIVCIRIIDRDRLLGTLRLNSMIPIYNKNVILDYKISEEKDVKYRMLVEKEIRFILKNKNEIIKKAEKLDTLKLKKGAIPLFHFLYNILYIFFILK